MKERPEVSANDSRRASSGRNVVVGLVIAALLAVGLFILLRGKPKPEAVQGQAGSRTNAAAVASAVVESNTAPAPTAGAAESSLDQLIRTLKNTSLPLSERKKAMLALAKDGSPKALGALKEVLGNSPPDVRRAIAAALSECPTPGGLAMLMDLLKDPDKGVAKAAVQALARQQQPQAATALAQLVNDSGYSIDVRCEAATALGALGQAWVLDPLSKAVKESGNKDVAETALDALGGLDFNVTKDFFRDYLQSADTPADLRIAAIDALSQAGGDPTALLAELAGKDSDADVRAEAAWAMSATDATGNAARQIMDMLSKETDPDVRLRLYQALQNQENVDPNAVLAMLQRETNPSAMVAAADTLAQVNRDNPNSGLQATFDRDIVPKLVQIALNGETFDERQAAILALARNPNDPVAMQALQQLSSQVSQTETTSKTSGQNASASDAKGKNANQQSAK